MKDKTICITQFIVYCTILFLHQAYAQGQSGFNINFPKVSEPIAITKGPLEHFYASYYGINSFNESETYALVLETTLKYVLPPNDEIPATLGLVNIETKEFIPIAKTYAWNFQQGCMAHWLGTSPDSMIIYNDLRNGKFVSVIMNVFTKEERIIPYPVSAVSPNGKEAVSINFSRLRFTRPDYGYAGNGQTAKMDIQFPDDDGIFLVNLRTGEAKLIVSIEQVKDLVPFLGNGRNYFNHTLFSRDGSKIFWIARAILNPNTISHKGTSTAFTVNRDGSNLQRCFPDGWIASHFDWLNDNELMITGFYKEKLPCHILFTVGKQDYRVLGNGLLDWDGHGTFSSDERWMVTDRYPDELHMQKICLLDMKTQATLPLGRYLEPPEYNGYWRCDIHCRWSLKGNIIGFNSTHEGSRQAYVFKLSY